MSGPFRRAPRGRAARILAGLLASAAVSGHAAEPRLLVMDLPYERVWDAAVRALADYPVARAADGVIETRRVERAPRPGEGDAERIAERITVRVEAVSAGVTRVTVAVDAEARRAGRWTPLGAAPDTVQAVLGRIRAGIG